MTRSILRSSALGLLLALATVCAAQTPRVGGTASGYACDGMDLLSRLPLSNVATTGSAAPSAGNDVWGWTDPVTGRGYALERGRSRDGAGSGRGRRGGVFVTVGGDGGEHLLATGVVEGGEALVSVPSEVALDSGTEAGAGAWYFGETAALELRVYDGASESSAEARRVTLGSDGSALAGVRMAAGDVVVVDAAKGSAVGGSSPVVFAVQGVSPNPATTSATVRFTSPSAVSASVVVYDLLGRVVETAFSGEAVEGLNEVSVSTGRLPAGVYVVRVTAGAESATARATVVR